MFRMNITNTGAGPKANMISRYYLRFTVSDRGGSLGGYLGSPGANTGSRSPGFISRSMVFKEGRGVPIMILTHRAREGAIDQALQSISHKSYVRAKTVLLRIAE